MGRRSSAPAIHRLGVAILIGVAAWITTAQGQQGEPLSASYVAGELLLKFRPGVSRARQDDLLAARSARVLRRFETLALHHVGLPPGQSVEAGMAAFRADPDVEFVQPNYIRHIAAQAPPNDPYWLNGTLYGLLKIMAPAAWTNFTAGDGSVVVGHLDTGVNYNHPDLAANIWVNPRETGPTSEQGPAPNCTSRGLVLDKSCNNLDDDGNGYVDDVRGIDAADHDNDPMDELGHGTQTAGILGALGNNGIGVVGVNWRAQILPCKIFRADGAGPESAAIECFTYITALKNRGVNIRVSNNSWGGSRPGENTLASPPALMIAIEAAGAAGILNVFAAGNQGLNADVSPFDPASYPSPSIVSVAMSDGADDRAANSNFGATSVDLAAPGVSILSTDLRNGYSFGTGTSHAAAYVSGTAALLFTLKPGLTVTAAKALLLNTVDALGAWSGTVVSGGRLNAYAAAYAASVDIPPTVDIASPAAGLTMTASQALTVMATADDADGSVKSVTFFANEVAIGTDTTRPYSVDWSPIAGDYTLTAVAADNAGATTTSAAVAIHVTTGRSVSAVASSSASTFLRTDTTTRGTWRGVYGSQGSTLANDATSLPGYAQVALGGQAAWTWASSTTDTRALQRVAISGRLAATWYAYSTFSIDVTLTDGASHQVALYGVDWDALGRSQRVDVVDAQTGAVLDTRTFTGFSGGQYLVWSLTGHVTLRVTNTGPGNAVVSGLFFDPIAGVPPANVPPAVSLTAPANGATLQAAAATAVTATATDTDGAVTAVAFFAKPAGGADVPLGTDTTSPYSVSWSPAVGDYTLTAVATDNAGATTTSAAITVHVPAGGGSGPSGPAVFLRTDTTTRGTWRGVYGSQGSMLANDTTSLPGYAQVALSGQGAWTWATSTTDTRALQRTAGSATGSDRLAATWYGSAFTIDITLTDGASHQVALYGVDWDALGRSQRVDVVNAQTGAVLDTRTFTSFSAGQYLVWSLTGHVTLRVTNTGPGNAVVGGLFFDPIGGAAPANVPPAVSLTAPANGATLGAAAATAVTATATDTDGAVTAVAFFAKPTGGADVPLGTDTTSPYSVTWSPAAGDYTLTAVATDNAGATTTSAAITVHVPASGGSGPSVFLRTDTTTRGTWRGVYGSQGSMLANDTTSLPGYAQVALSGQGAWTWATSTTDTRALQRTAVSGRLAATWYGSTFTIDITLTDGASHQVAMYGVDWDALGRSQRVDVMNAQTGAVLDTRTLTSFSGGQYLVWNLTGHVTLRVTNTGPANAIVSGLFFDPAGQGDPAPASEAPTKARANSYDREWKSAWVNHARQLLATPGKTDGFVLQIGDSISYYSQNSAWPKDGQGQTSEDAATVTWARARSWSAGGLDLDNKNGWYLSSAGRTAIGGLSTIEFLTGCCNSGPDMPATSDPVVARQILADPTYPYNRHIDTVLAAFRDAQFAVVMLGTNDPDRPTTTSELNTIVDKLEAQHIVPILSTIPPRYDVWPNQLNIQLNAAIASLARARSLPLIDFYQEIMLRRPGTTYQGTLIGDGIHPTGDRAGYSIVSDPYLPGGNPATHTTGDALLNVGYLLRSWLTIQKLKEVKAYVIDGINPP